jgi:hypothetical protein
MTIDGTFDLHESSAFLGIFLAVAPLYIISAGSVNIRSISALSDEAVQQALGENLCDRINLKPSAGRSRCGALLSRSLQDQ